MQKYVCTCFLPKVVDGSLKLQTYTFLYLSKSDQTARLILRRWSGLEGASKVRIFKVGEEVLRKEVS